MTQNNLRPIIPSITVAVDEYEGRTFPELSINRAEFDLIQALRRTRKQSILLVMVDGAGVPKCVQVIESPFVKLG